MLGRLSLLLPVTASLLLLTGARGCNGEVPIGEECAADACGPELGLPTLMCDDGSIGGNTGHCLANAAGTCSWEIRECPPPPECTDADCGPIPPQLPGSPALECRMVGDACQWTPGDECVPDDCGPAPGTPTYLCADGTTGGFTGRCLLDASGMCGWEINDCPMGGECTVEECGPAPGAPNFLCADGSWGGPTGCERDAAGACGYGWRDCPEAIDCADDAICPSGMHCELGVCYVGEGCGGMTCDYSTQYCRETIGGIPGAPPSYACDALPEECATAPTCDVCFPSLSGAECSLDAQGLHVTFFAP